MADARIGENAAFLKATEDDGAAAEPLGVTLAHISARGARGDPESLGGADRPGATKLFAKAIKPGTETTFLQVEEAQEEPEQKTLKVLQQMAVTSHGLR